MRPRVERVFAAVSAVIGADELALIGALALLVVGLWPIVGRCALIVPGIVWLWLALPSRHPLVSRPPVAPEKPARRTT